jgi:hypothetical protein
MHVGSPAMRLQPEKANFDPAEVTAARAKIRSLQHGRRFEMVGLMVQSLHAMRGAL